MSRFKVRRVTVRDASVLVAVTPCETPDTHKNEEVLTLTLEDYEACHTPTVGDVLSEEETARLRHGDRRHAALTRALRILAAGDNSTSLLFSKLRRHGVDRPDAAFAVKYAVSHGLLREEEQIERLICRSAEEKLWGRTRILHELEAKGYHREDVRTVIARLESDGTLDFAAVYQRLREKSRPEDPAEWAKIAARHGFDNAFLDADSV